MRAFTSRLLKNAAPALWAGTRRRWTAWALDAAYRKYASLGLARSALPLGLPEQPRRRRTLQKPARGVGRTGARGFTLLEVLVSGALFSVVVGGIYLLYTTMQGTLIRGEMKSDLQQNARTGLDRMLQELRMAGYDPQNALAQVATQKFVALRAAGATCLSFVSYRVVGGVERSVRVTYTLTGTELERTSADWDAGTSSFSGGNTQPVASSVNQLTFAYFDTVNALLQPSVASTGACPPGGASTMPLLSGDQAGRVRRVGVALRTLDSRPRTPAESYTVTSYVYLRNQ